MEAKPGDWVLMDNDNNIIFANADGKIVCEEAKKYPVDEVIISKVPVVGNKYYNL